MTETALEMLQKRAIVGFNEEDFKNKIKYVLNAGKRVSDISDMSFLKKFGVHLDDANSLKRMAAQVYNCTKTVV